MWGGLVNRFQAERQAQRFALQSAHHPTDPSHLRAAIEACLDDAVPPRPDRPIGLIVPHGSYADSGQICADAYRMIVGHDYDLVVVLAPLHAPSARAGIWIHAGSSIDTPLGAGRIDTAAAAALRAAEPECSFDATVHESEPSIAIQVPFLQVVLPGTPLLPVLMGPAAGGLCVRLGRALGSILESRRSLLIASTDLSTMFGREGAAAVDHATLAAIASMDPLSVLARESGLLCGLSPVLTILEASKALGAHRGAVISYASSADATLGPRSGPATGFGSVVFLQGRGDADVSVLGPRPEPPPGDGPIAPAEAAALLRFARESIRRHLATGTTPLFRSDAAVLYRRQGAFVTLTREGQLRGCVGHEENDLPLGQVVGAMALHAALDDGRFPTVRLDELDGIEIEISLLTRPVAVARPEQIVLGRHGIVLRNQGRSAIFLPQVAKEQGWSLETTLDHLSRKAGLPTDCWRHDAELLVFETQVLGESRSP